jgi:hypothetical protein
VNASDSLGGVASQKTISVCVDATPTITSITETPATGDLGVGCKVAITLTTSEPLTNITGGYGTTLSLNDGGTATYDPAASTSSSFVFDYNVAAGQNTSSLAVTAVNMNGVVAEDAAGNPVNPSLAGLTQTGPEIDTSECAITGKQNLEISGACAEKITFATGSAGTLVLDQATQFSGDISGFATGDCIDLKNIAFNAHTTLGYSQNSAGTGGTLSIGHGSHIANIALLGNYMASSFVASSDGHGGTLISDPSVHQQALLAQPHA